MTVKVTIRNDGNHILQAGRSIELHLVTASSGQRDMVVVEEGDSDMHFLNQ